nr:MAG TPA: hypothetical protein [Caudoviricetes sp.]
MLVISNPPNPRRGDKSSVFSPSFPLRGAGGSLSSAKVIHPFLPPKDSFFNH